MKLLGLVIVVVVLWKVTPPDISLLSFVAMTIGTMFVLRLLANKLT